ncbi:MAG: diguanylate cyclase/phosphodiesterase with sensor(s), partial [Armatimonadetes bacterium]|nr:diguanylate cyclase/phosphodiesterase with sensor(s) [Armatimonadota bacterium]
MPESARTSTFLTVGLLDSPAEEAFDRLTRLASRVLSVPLAAVTLSDGNHQFWKSVAGIPDSMIAQRELPVEGNCFCRWVGDTGEQLVIPDTSLHPLGSNNPTADELSLHSFLGVPLPGPEGSCLGCFAVADTVPRSWTADDVETLAELAVSVSTEIQLRHTAQTAAAERERYARLLNDVDAIVWEAEADTWRFTFVSGRAEALLGYPVARWLHEPGFWSSLLHPDDRERAVRYCTEWTAAGEDHEFEYRAITASGRTVWLRDLVRVIPAEDGRPAQLRGVMLDITCQKEAELALIERELRFRSLIENSSDLITVLGRDATVLYQSPSIRRILGYEPEVLLAGRAVDFVHPDDLPAVRDLFGNRQAQLPSDPSVSFLYRFRARDGAWRWLESTATDLGEDPVIRGLVINSRDVTQRVEIEVAYRQSEERYRRIVETASEGVWITDLEGRTTFVNSQMARMLGYTPDEMVGREVQAFLPEEDYAALEARLLRRREGITEQFDLRCLRKDGSEVWLLVSATPLRSDEGSHLGSLSMVSDITERKRSEDALREERR